MKMSIDEQLKQELDYINVSDEQKQKLFERCENIDNIDSSYNSGHSSLINRLRINKFIPISLVTSFALFFIIYTVQKDSFPNGIQEDGFVMEGVTNNVSSTALSPTESVMDTNEVLIEFEIDDTSYNYYAENSTSIYDSTFFTYDTNDTERSNIENNIDEDNIYADNSIYAESKTLQEGKGDGYTENMKNYNYIGVGSIDFIEENNDIITITATITTTQSITDELYGKQQITFDITREKIQYLDIYNTDNIYIFNLHFNNGVYTTDSILEPIMLNN